MDLNKNGEIIKAIDVIVQRRLEEEIKKMDKTITTTILGKKDINNGEYYIYTVNIDGRKYNINDHSSAYNVGEKVFVTIPSGNYSNMFIAKPYGSIFDDSGWINVSATKGTWNYLQYRKVENRVTVRGHASSFAWSGSIGDNFLNIPSGNRPTKQIYFYGLSSGNRISRLYLTAAGNLGMDYLINMSTDTGDTNSTWLFFEVSYYID